MSIVNLFLNLIELLSRHRWLLFLLLLVSAAPSIFLAVPDVLTRIAELSPQARWTLAGVAAVVIGAVVFALMQGVFRALVRAWRRRLSAAEERRKAEVWDSAFVNGDLDGAETVAIVYRVAGSVCNILRTSSMLSSQLRAELGLASRGVVVLPDNSPGVGVDTRPELVNGEWGEKVAEFKKHPVRDDAGVASRQSSLWLSHQEPYLVSFIASCESRIGIQVIGRGCSSLTDALSGFGSRVRGTESNFIFYIHDRQENFEEDEDLEPDDDDEEPSENGGPQQPWNTLPVYSAALK